MTQTQQFVYHLVPKQLQGNSLYPLRQLQVAAPELAEFYAQKYKGREAVQERSVPPLDCLWNDVLMFCPVHPRQIQQTEAYARQMMERPLQNSVPICAEICPRSFDKDA